MLRREFLAGIACTLAKGAETAPHRIDVHHHLFPPAYRAAIGTQAAPLPQWSPAQSIEEMDKGGIATAVLSLSSPGVWFGDAEQARRLSRIVNDYGAMQAKDHRGRFGLFAALPLPDIDGSLREIEYALDTLKADGIGLFTSYGDKWLGDAAFAPVWAELNRRKALVYTHPITAACCGNLKNEVPAVMIEWATDTTRTIASLLFSGAAARYPDIRWIFSHGGGTMPFLLSRFVYQEATMKGKDRALPKGLMYELKKFYYDTAQANSAPALAALLKVVDASQVVFGTDYPFRTAAEVNGGLNAQHFAAKALRAIERDNALRLMPELAKTVG
ncbi:MAG TPA: amidohydrolase family protein [Terracidiphilus sp.]